MPKRTVRLADTPGATGKYIGGMQSVKSLLVQLEKAFDRDLASEFSPLKVVISFDGLDDVGTAPLEVLVAKIRDIYQQELSWYVTFTGLDERASVYRVLGSLLRLEKLSIVCEPHAKMFCGVTERDITARGSRLGKDWRGKAIVIDRLHKLENNKFLETDALLRTLGTANYGSSKARQILRDLDEQGIILWKYVTKQATREYAHVAKYNPEE